MEDLKIVHVENADDSMRKALQAVISMEMLKSLEEDECMIYAAADDDDYLIGIMAVQEGATGLLIRHIYVLPDDRRMGVGTALIQYLVEEIREAGLLCPVVTRYMDDKASELLHVLFLKQPNFYVQPGETKYAGKTIKITEALWNGMTLWEMADLFDDTEDPDTEDTDTEDLDTEDLDTEDSDLEDPDLEELQIIRENEEIDESEQILLQEGQENVD